MKKILKKISMMLLVICSLFTMFVSGGSKVSALDTSKRYPITEYLRGKTNDLDTTNLNWFDGSFSDYETYLFNFDTKVNDLVKEIENVIVKYQTCKFNVGGKCWVYSDYKTYTISSDYYYNSFSKGYFIDKELKQQNLGILSATGNIEEYKTQAFKYFQGYLKDNVLKGEYDTYNRIYHEEYTTFDEYYTLLEEMKTELSSNWNAQLSSNIGVLSMYLEEDTMLANLFVDGVGSDLVGMTDGYNIKMMINDLEKYDWYFILPVEETMYNFVISADVINNDGSEWTMIIDSELNNLHGDNPIADFIEKAKNLVKDIVDFFKNNTWAFWLLLALLLYPILQIAIRLLVVAFNIIMIPINIILGIFDGVGSAVKDRRKRRKEEKKRERERERIEERRIVENTQYNNKKLKKYRKY